MENVWMIKNDYVDDSETENQKNNWYWRFELWIRII